MPDPAVSKIAFESTELHQIARHMGQAYMSKFDPLTFARRKEMMELQDVAIKALPESSVHGISNIAWALSTISGSAIYFGEMDLMAKTASDSVEEFKPQNLANMADAFVYKSMQHLSSPFFSLCLNRQVWCPQIFSPTSLSSFFGHLQV